MCSEQHYCKQCKAVLSPKWDLGLHCGERILYLQSLYCKHPKLARKGYGLQKCQSVHTDDTNTELFTEALGTMNQYSPTFSSYFLTVPVPESPHFYAGQGAQTGGWILAINVTE